MSSSISLNAYNLIEGATFSNGYEAYIAMTVTRNTDTETVTVWARRGDLIAEGKEGFPNHLFKFHFMDQINLIGLVIHPLDPNDNNWGNQ